MNRRSFLLSPAVLAAAAQTNSTRPHLYFSDSDIARLRPGIKSNRNWDRLLESAKRLLDGELVTEEVARRGGGQHANYGQPGNQISAMGLTLGLAWHVTQERQYAEKLRAALLHYSTYERWNGQGKEGRTPQWKSELNGARFCYGFGTGYDALHGFLSPADRKQIASAIARLGVLPVLEDWILPETRIHAIDSMGHNWWSVCVSMAGVAALSLLGDDKRAPEWLALISRGLAQWFAYPGDPLQNKPANFDSAGGFYEGINYVNYALSEYLRFRLAYDNVFPGARQPRFKPLEQTTDFFLNTLYPTSSTMYTLNFGDSGLHNDSSPTVRLLLETGFAHPSAGWYLERTAGIPTRGIDPLILLARKTASGQSPDKLPQSAIYPGMGWATMRSSWNDNATMLAVRSGFSWNHAHSDAGSFVLFHDGAPLITDSGSCSYSNPLYSRYYVQSRAHNVILFNGQGQPTEDIRRGVKTPGSVHGLVDGHGIKYVYADSAGPMSRYFSRNFRHWLWVDGAILIFDDVLAHEEGRFDWLLHYGGSAKVDGNSIRLENETAKAEVRFLFPADLAMREESGYADHRPERPAPYLAFSPKQPSREAKFVTAILPGGCGAEVESLSAPLAIGVRVKQGSQATDVYFNLQSDGRRMHDNSNNTIDGWETDASLLALTRPSGAAATPDSVTRYFVSGGSYLRKSGRVVLDSLTKVQKVWRSER